PTRRPSDRLAVLELALQRPHSLLAERAQLGVLAVRKLLGRGKIILEPPERGKVPGDGLEARVLARQLAEAILVGDRPRVAQKARELLVALCERRQLLANGFVHDAIVSQPRREPRRSGRRGGAAVDALLRSPPPAGAARRLSGSAALRTRENAPEDRRARDALSRKIAG